MEKRTNRTKAVFRDITEISFSDFTDSGKPTEEISQLNYFCTSWIRKRILQIFKGETDSLLLASSAKETQTCFSKKKKK